MLYAVLLAAPALLLALPAWILYRPEPQKRMFCLVIIIAMGYWYVLPGTLFLLGGELAAADADLLKDDHSIEWAILLVHACLATLLLLPAFLAASDKPHRLARSRPGAEVSLTSQDMLLSLVFVSSVFFLFNRYAELGPAFVLQLLLGLTSAREVMSFQNFSEGASTSLLALWDIVNIFISIFLATALTWQGRTRSMRFVGAVAAALLSFISSGSRSVLLMLIFAMTIALVCRPRTKAAPRIGRAKRRKTLAILLTGALVALAAVGMSARFQDDPSQSDSLALNSIGAHNDMFRELVYVLRNGWSYRSDALLFLQTPITYAMPSFLGFNKSIPPHVLDFNLDRAGIDLISGEGNVFPGLIADMYLCFNMLAPVVLFALAALMIRAAMTVSSLGTNLSVNAGLLIALLCYFLISFRNLHGAFGIVLVVAGVLSLFLSVNFNRRNVKPRRRLPGTEPDIPTTARIMSEEKDKLLGQS